MTAKPSCPSCGATIASTDRFCGDCGRDLSPEPAPSAPAQKPRAGAAFNKTMLGVSPVQLATEPARATETPISAKPVPQRTMLGMASPLLSTQEPAAAPPSGGAAQASPAAPPRAAGGPVPKKTLLGVAAVAPEAAKEAPSAVATPPAASEAPAKAKPTQAAADPKAEKLKARSNRTMLGVVGPGAPAGAAASLPAHDVEDAAVLAEASDTSPGRLRSFTPTSGPKPVSLQPPPAMRWAWLAVGALAMVAVGGGVLAWLSARGPELSVRVLRSGGSEQLEVEAPGSPTGAKARFLGEVEPLAAGRARFPLKADALKIGDNELTIDILAPDGAIASSAVKLQVAYRARVDTSQLGAANPEIDVVVDALAGSKVTVDGAPLALDAHGHGVRAFPVTPQAGGSLNFAAKYRVEPPGEPPEEGKLELSLPLASMQIDRPGPEVVTDQKVLEVAGAVEPDAEVSIDGAQVPVNDGRFLQRVTLDEPGTRVLKVVARAPGKAPRVAEIKVEHVADLTLAAASFTPDPSLTYARLAQSPVVYRGQKVAFDGRVYNVEVEAGKSVLQMLVLDCPGQNRCPLWVEYPQATEATIDSWVRVLGVVAGEQQFRSRQGQVQTVPSVHAQYVLKLANKKK